MTWFFSRNLSTVHTKPDIFKHCWQSHFWNIAVSRWIKEKTTTTIKKLLKHIRNGTNFHPTSVDSISPFRLFCVSRFFSQEVISSFLHIIFLLYVSRLFLLKDCTFQFLHWLSQNRTAKNNTKLFVLQAVNINVKIITALSSQHVYSPLPMWTILKRFLGEEKTS